MPTSTACCRSPLNYGKDMHTLQKRSSDIILQKRRRSLSPTNFSSILDRLGFCLISSDEAFHHPFQCNFSLAARSNIRIRVRGEASAEHRRQRTRSARNGEDKRVRIGGNPQARPRPGGNPDSPAGTPDIEATADGKRRPSIADIPAFAFEELQEIRPKYFQRKRLD